MERPRGKPKSRDTGTGRILEQMIIPALVGGGYQVSPQHNIGVRFTGRKHVVDVAAQDSSGRKILVSLKWQQVSGTAEQKVPFEVICLAEAILSGHNEYEVAYLVLGGEGWTLRDFFVKGGLDKHLTHSSLVRILSLEGFVAKANRGEL